MAPPFESVKVELPAKSLKLYRWTLGLSGGTPGGAEQRTASSPARVFGFVCLVAYDSSRCLLRSYVAGEDTRRRMDRPRVAPNRRDASSVLHNCFGNVSWLGKCQGLNCHGSSYLCRRNVHREK